MTETITASMVEQGYELRHIRLIVELYKIAEDFLNDMNPSRYDGHGFPIPQVDFRLWEAQIDGIPENIQMCLVCDNIPSDWHICIDIVDDETDDLLGSAYTNNISSLKEIVKAILEALKEAYKRR